MHCSPPRICWLRRDSRGCNRRSASSRPSGVDGSRNDAVPVYLTGLGTVQASNTVAVTAQVEGVLQTVAFVEGQDVKKGQLLVQIDPRPYKAQLEQAIFRKAADEAQLDHARRDLDRYAN